MKKQIYTLAILFGLLVNQVAFTCSSCYAAKLTRKQKKENMLLDVAKASFDEKQYDTAIEYYTKALHLNPDNAETYSKRGNAEFL